MIKKYLINLFSTGLDDCIYELQKEEDKVTLLTTEFGFMKSGKKDASLKCTGDGYIFKDYFSGRTVNLDYSQAHNLRLLLDIIEEDELKYKIFSESKDD